MTLHTKALANLESIDRKIAKTEAELRALPEGSLICQKNGNYYKWFHRTGSRIDGSNGQRKYISKRNWKFATALARKTYLTKELSDLKREKKAIQSYIRQHRDENTQVEKLLHQPGMLELIPQYNNADPYVQHWLEMSYESNPIFEDELKFRTINGQKVRSKSEALIVSELVTNEIPFRYECGLELGTTIVYPDFTILHPESHKEYYWEHFGMMDDPTYREKTHQKIERYIKEGYLPTDRLILTYESSNIPLDTSYVHSLITHYFL